jgi:hypothetical protein
VLARKHYPAVFKIVAVLGKKAVDTRLGIGEPTSQAKWESNQAFSPLQ